MNAKFEKWAEREGLRINRKGDLRQERYGQYARDDTQLAYEAWKSAIQSLEVTPELCHTAYETLISHTGRLLDGSIECIEEDMHVVLIAVLSALKEQAK